jgi:hypothetical protein
MTSNPLSEVIAQNRNRPATKILTATVVSTGEDVSGVTIVNVELGDGEAFAAATVLDYMEGGASPGDRVVVSLSPGQAIVLGKLSDNYVPPPVIPPSQVFSAGIISTQIAAAEVTLATMVVDEEDYGRIARFDAHAFITGAATTAGVIGDVWEVRLKKDGVSQHRWRWQNSRGSSWQQTVGGTVTVGVSAGVPPATVTWTMTILRVAGSGGCRTFSDGSTNQLSAVMWPQ